MERIFLNMVYFLGPWVDGQGLTFDLKAVQSFWARYIRGEGQMLDDLPAVPNSTAEHHTEDHPDDLLKRKVDF